VIVLLSLGVAIAAGLYFGSVTIGATDTIASVMDGYNCSTITDCKIHIKQVVESPDDNVTYGVGTLCAVDFCMRACEPAGDDVTRCHGGMCVMNLACKKMGDDDGDLGGRDAALKSQSAVRFVLLGILVFAMSCCVGTATLMTNCTRRLCSLCRRRFSSKKNKDGDAESGSVASYSKYRADDQ
jgi:hypothetical protein